MRSMRAITVEMWTQDNDCELFTVNHVSTEDAMREVFNENQTKLTSDAIVRFKDGSSLTFDGTTFTPCPVDGAEQAITEMHGRMALGDEAFDKQK